MNGMQFLMTLGYALINLWILVVLVRRGEAKGVIKLMKRLLLISGVLGLVVGLLAASSSFESVAGGAFFYYSFLFFLGSVIYLLPFFLGYALLVSWRKFDNLNQQDRELVGIILFLILVGIGIFFL